MNAVEAVLDSPKLIVLRLCAGCGFILGRRPCLLIVPWSLGRASKEWLYFHPDRPCKDLVRKKLEVIPKRPRRGS